MSIVRLDLNISLDGFASGGQSETEPMGEDWNQLTKAYVSTRTFLSRVLGDTSGKGTTGVDDKYASKYFEGIGAEILGAGMYGFHAHPEDADWQGWWGDKPPFGMPVFILTHTAPRESISFENGTTFHFRNSTVTEVLSEAKIHAAEKDVRIGGGVRTALSYLQLNLVDQVHFAIAPIILGRGVPVLSELAGLHNSHTATTEVAESGTIHITFNRDK